MKSSQVNSKSGSPALYVDDERRVPILFGLSDFPGAATNTAYAQKNIANFAAQGIHLITADVELWNGWHKSTPFEWEAIRAEIDAWKEKKESLEANASYNELPWYGLDDDEAW